jgi:glutamate--cysteine ligase
VLEGVRQHGGFANYTLQLSQQHQRQLLTQGLDVQGDGKFQASVRTSWQAQRQIEAQEQGSFEDYVAHYFA